VVKVSRLTLILAGLAALGPFSIDTYLPSFAAIGEHFGVSLLQVQGTLSYYLVALAFMMLFHGALSDSFGRRPVILVSLAVYSGAALGCALAPSFGWLLAFRVLQGFAAGAGIIVGRAIIRDRFEGAQAHQLMAQVTMLFGLAPAVAPILGGYLHTFFGWQSVFLFLTLFGAVILVASVMSLPETLPAEARTPFRPAPLARTYLSIFGNGRFVALVLSLGLGFGGFLLYVASAADFVQGILGLSDRGFAWLFVPLVFGLVGGSWLVNLTAGRVEANRLAFYGYLLMFGGAAFNLSYNALFTPQVPWAVLPLAFYTLGVALQAPIVTLYALDLFPRSRGLAASLQGFIQTMLFAGISSFVVPLIIGSGFKHALAMAVMLSLNYLGWRYFHATAPASVRPAEVASEAR
jgi:DHA1 family bicyclomycin/chloramphenicol resistance-like MFS transporter